MGAEEKDVLSFMVLTSDVFHLEMSKLKLSLPLKSCEMSVTKEVSQLVILPYLSPYPSSVHPGSGLSESPHASTKFRIPPSEQLPQRRIEK